MRRLGLGYRKQLGTWLTDKPEIVGNLEITAEHFFSSGEKLLRELSQQYEIFVHGLGLSLGTPGPLCKTTLESFARVAEIADAKWVSEHVAFSRTVDVDLGHLNPVPRTEDSLQTMIEHSMEVSEVCQRPIVLENITSSLDVGGTMDESDFLNRLCDGANCGLLLDVTNLFINSKNHGFDPLKWLRRITPSHITQLHVVGYSERDGMYHDHHSNRIQDDLMELIEAVLDYADVQAMTLERDERLEAVDEIESELGRLNRVLQRRYPESVS
jgi:uncharacterized protein (UPF0276 family)